MGRKPLPDEDRRDKPLRIRLTDAERDKLDSAADKAGYPATAGWARELLMEAAESVLASKRKKKRGQ